MMFVTFSNLWSFSFFLFLSYTMLITSLILYLFPVVNNFTKYTSTALKTYFSFINSFNMLPVLLVPLVLLIGILNLWSSPALSVWFGHILFTGFQYKITLFIVCNMLLYLIIFTTVTYFTSREVFDYTTVTFHFFYWVLLLFYANSVFTVIFLIEVIGALLFLLIVTSTFSTSFFYRNLNLNYGHMFQNVTPYPFLQSILYLFWISLISSLNLFIFILLLYFKLLTFDWYLMEHIFLYFIQISTFKEIFTLSIYWFIILICIFIKCGVAPLYIWKPTFFKGLPIYTLFFYITFFYFHFFLFILNFLVVSFSELFYFYINIFWLFILLGFFVLLFIICESYYLKVFLAISSILNSLLVFLILTSPHYVDSLFYL